MKIRNAKGKSGIVLLLAGLFVSACSTSPIQSRLNKNFVFNCSLELIKKDVPPADAERICTASHRGEREEAEVAADRGAREQRPAPPSPAPAANPEAAGVPARAPASTETAPAASALQDFSDPVAPGSH